MSEHLSPEYWNRRYVSHQIQWDIGEVSTPMKAYIDQLKDLSLKILIPGCGNAYEAYYLHKKGFRAITLVDISSIVTAKLIQHLKDDHLASINMVNADFFSMEDQFDLILEQTFFCALHPDLREAYVQKMSSLLRPGGKIAGVLFNREFEGGPPYGGYEEEYRKLFLPVFNIITLSPCYNSIPPRAGAEVFMIMQKQL